MQEHNDYDATSGWHYLQFTPKAPKNADSALVYLHGIGERGVFLPLVKNYGLPAMVARGEVALNCPLICPQLEDDNVWEPERLVAFIQSMRHSYGHIALVGYSLGGSGVCDLLSIFGPVAQLSICIAGQAPARIAAASSRVVFAAIQGELDPWPNTAAFVDDISAKGGVAHSINLSGRDHYVSEEAILHPQIKKLLASIGITLSNSG